MNDYKHNKSDDTDDPQLDLARLGWRCFLHPRTIPAMRTMKPEEIIKRIASHLDGVVPKASWREASLIYNPGHELSNGIDLCTIKEKDGNNDRSSGLSRAGLCRLSIGIATKTYEGLFGTKSKRPAKGGADVLALYYRLAGK